MRPDLNKSDTIKKFLSVQVKSDQSLRFLPGSSEAMIALWFQTKRKFKVQDPTLAIAIQDALAQNV